MSANLATSRLVDFSQFLAEQLGLHFPEERMADLERGIKAAAVEFRRPDVAECIEWLMSTPLTRKQIDVLASKLTVGETYFFRDKPTFDTLAEKVLPELALARHDNNRRIRVWSAACCTGEEAYSLAITLRQAVPDWKDWHITVLGSDINPDFLQRAAHGTYSEWSFRDVPGWLRERYFRRNATGGWEINGAIKRMVDFSQVNLAHDAYPALLNNTNAMDIIFCRNVLMYFTPEQARTVIEKLHRCLVEGGWLVLAPVESMQSMCPELLTVRFGDTVFFRKDSAAIKAAAASLQTRSERVVSTSLAMTPEAEPYLYPGYTNTQGTSSNPPEYQGESAGYKAAFALYEEGKYREAVELLTDGARVARDFILLARINANEGNLPAALAWSERAIEADRLDPVPHYLRGNVLNELGDFDGAEASFGRVLYLDPEFALAHLALSTLARKSGNTANAEKHLALLLELIRKEPPDAVLRDSEGMSAERMLEMVTSLMAPVVA